MFSTPSYALIQYVVAWKDVRNINYAYELQFMVHDWIDHLEETQQIEFTAPREVAGECPLKSFKFYKTKVVYTGFHDIKKGHLNTRTPWWDGSAIYGSDLTKLQKLRTFKDGKPKIGKDGLLQHDNDGVLLSGDVRHVEDVMILDAVEQMDRIYVVTCRSRYCCGHVPVAIGGLGLSAGVRFRKDVPSGGLANVAANVMNLHGFVAPEDYETTLMEVSLSGTPKEAITLSEVPSAVEERDMSSVLSIY
ncbi:alpha-dioxygenase 1-like protein [Tanacetum coccineum]